MKNIVLSLLLFFVFSCSSVRVNYDYQSGTDFSGYTTYNYFTEMDTGLSQLDEQRLIRVLDSALTIKGIRLSEEPTFLINIKSEVYQRASGNTVGVGVGGGGRNVGGGVSVGIPIGSSSINRAIIFDFVDTQRNQLIWQADTESGFRDNAAPSVREDMLRKVVDKALTKFPPEKK
ncbi:DUF4136 domain-containing protein [Croceivirga thetidis]|uniref:DUF4136 domain-containing protein n=1 Tax=Croceivirga thetidis TaxID=2721623 RepID=A0ABX1GTH0_9FLAO|nr:DUF4136 domain-containing protein [Croceivirga thetidis]NKI33263.1 DUF4136 domain-containing protein [Croceivirga thetidis]